MLKRHIAPRFALIATIGLLLAAILLLPLGGILLQALKVADAGSVGGAAAGSGAANGSGAAAGTPAPSGSGAASGTPAPPGSGAASSTPAPPASGSTAAPSPYTSAQAEPSALAAAINILGQNATWQALWNSLLMAAASAFATLVFALPGAWCLARYRFPGRRFFLAASSVGFVLPGILIILALIAFWGRAGAVNFLLGSELNFVYSPLGIILAHVIFNSALVIRMCMPAFAQSDPLLADAARSLGMGPLRIFFAVDLPAAGKRIVAAWLLVFLYCFLSFAVVLLFGGVGFVTLEIAVYHRMYQAADPAGAAVLAIFQLLWTFGIALGLGAMGRAGSSRMGKRVWVASPIGKQGGSTRLAWALYWLFWTALTVLPFAALAIRAIIGGGFAGLAESAGRLQRIIGNSWLGLFGLSLGLALLSGTLATMLSFFAARAVRAVRQRVVDAIFTLPLMVSGVTLALGYSFAFGHSASPVLLVLLVQTVTAFPVSFGIWREAYLAIPPNLDQAARSLGATVRRRMLGVELPLLRGSAVSAFVMAATISFADFTTVFVIGQGRLITVPVAIYRLIGHHSFPEALALGVLYLGFTGLVFALVQPRFRSGGLG